jgi:hypothetical protein
MQNTSETKKVSDLTYQGPLIGMRSTRTKPVPADSNSKTIPAKQ